MNVKIYACGELAYDSQLPVEEHFSILSAQIQEGINKGGMATLLLPPDHRLYDGFPAMRACVEIYRDDKLRWRGRALAHEDDFWGRRTVPCEGELCFLNDSSMRPYALHGSPQDLLGQILGVHNATVDPWKRLILGTVTIPTRDITVESKMPEKCYTAVQRLLKEAGGYLLIDTAADGQRQLNWYANLPDNCNQFIRLGENLLDYDSSANIAGIATRIVPYGAAGEDGKRIQINVDGRDYVDNLEAQQLRGIIEVPRVYNEITDPEVLRKVAERDVMTSGMLPERIKLSAVDLSRVDATLDQFAVGRMVHAESERHKLSGTYAIVELAEDLVQPSSGSISLVRDAMYYDGIPTLSGSVSADLRQQASDLSAQGAQIMADMQVAIEAATSWLTNGQGYMVQRRDPHTGQVIDTLYMDTPDINTAVNVLRLGQSGIGFSHNGVNGPYVSAWTIDGKFNASFILAGVLTATIIKTGILSDKLGRNYINLDTGETRIQADELTICGKTTETIAGEIANAAAQEAKEAAAQALNDYKSIINRTVEDLQGQIDGAIENWFGAELPTTTNVPAKDWTTPEEKAKHLGDLYYVDDNPDCGGQVYRWMQSGAEYRWKIVEDTEVAKALAEAAKAKDTADGKRRVFVTQPLPPYDVGDLWAQGTNGDLLVCKASRVTGAQYLRSDWGPVADYVNSQTAQQIANQAAANPINKLTQAQIFNKLTNNGQIEGIYMQGGKLYLNASYIASGEIASRNRNVVINLDTGATTILDGLINLGNGNFMVDSTGYFQANVGKIGGLRIANSGLISDYVEFGPNGMLLKNGFERTVARIKPTIKTNRSPNDYMGLNMVATGQTDAIVISKEENPTTGQVIPILAYALASCGGAFTADAINMFVDLDMQSRVIRNAAIDPRTSGARGGYSGTVGVGGYTLSFEGGFLMDVW